MRIEPNEISDYEYIQRKLREQARELLKTAKKQKRPIRYLPQGISGDSVRWWADLKKYGKRINK
nr:hypothetical protein [uncultured Capnocytophaga sp.]